MVWEGAGQAREHREGPGECRQEVLLVGGEVHHPHLVKEQPVGRLHVASHYMVQGEGGVVAPVLCRWHTPYWGHTVSVSSGWARGILGARYKLPNRPLHHHLQHP